MARDARSPTSAESQGFLGLPVDTLVTGQMVCMAGPSPTEGYE